MIRLDDKVDYERTRDKTAENTEVDAETDLLIDNR